MGKAQTITSATCLYLAGLDPCRQHGGVPEPRLQLQVHSPGDELCILHQPGVLPRQAWVEPQRQAPGRVDIEGGLVWGQQGMHGMQRGTPIIGEGKRHTPANKLAKLKGPATKLKGTG
jgi:hypothetical protein